LAGKREGYFLLKGAISQIQRNGQLPLPLLGPMNNINMDTPQRAGMSRLMAVTACNVLARA
jgi:hypothetical protein